MKTITYTFGILALLTVMSSCTAEELESAGNSTTSETIQRVGDIDPPLSPPKK